MVVVATGRLPCIYMYTSSIFFIFVLKRRSKLVGKKAQFLRDVSENNSVLIVLIPIPQPLLLLARPG